MCLPGLVLALLSIAYASVTNCGKNSLFQVTSLSVDPPSVVSAGQNVSLTLKYTSPEVIVGGTSTTSLTYNFIPFTPTVEDLCKSVTCPLLSGDHDGSTSYEFPVGLNGNVVSQFVWKDLSSRELLCIKVTLKASRL